MAEKAAVGAARRHAGRLQAGDRTALRRAPHDGDPRRGEASARGRALVRLRRRRAICSTHLGGAGRARVHRLERHRREAARRHRACSPAARTSTSRPTASTRRCSGPTSSEGSDVMNLFVADVVREMTQKTGQKCTAIRRIYVPRATRRRRCATRCASGSRDVKVGDPARETSPWARSRPRSSSRDVRAGIERLAARRRSCSASTARGEADRRAAGQGLLRRARRCSHGASRSRTTRCTRTRCSARSRRSCRTTTCGAAVGRSSPRAAAGWSRRVYSDDKDVPPRRRCSRHRAVPRARRSSARRRSRGSRSRPGTVLPQLLHGGPGRAGGGEELGGRRGMSLYMQRTALQGDRALIEAIAAKK